MNNKKLVILGIITAFMIAWAVVQSCISNKPSTGLNALTYLIQGLDPSDIDSIILGTGDDATTLKRNGEQFLIVNKDNYPAVTSEISNLITACLGIRISELYTDSPANHKNLGVTEQEAKQVVKFLKPDSSLLAGVIVGRYNERGGYVRMVPGNNVYHALESPGIKGQALDYIYRVLFSLNRCDIEGVVISSPDETYTLKPKEGPGVVLIDIPAGRKLKEDDSEKVFSVLTDIRFDDVKKGPLADEELAFVRKFECKLKDSTLYTIEIARKEDKTFLKCQAEFTDKTPVTKEPGIESEEELKIKESKLFAQENAINFSARHEGWVYEIPEYKAKELVKGVQELLEDEQEEKREPEE